MKILFSIIKRKQLFHLFFTDWWKKIEEFLSAYKGETSEITIQVNTLYSINQKTSISVTYRYTVLYLQRAFIKTLTWNIDKKKSYFIKVSTVNLLFLYSS